MREEHLKYLVCPLCVGELILDEAHERQDASIAAGILRCSSCGKTYPIIGHIPRFCALDNYAAGFGLEWTRHARTQFDSYTGSRVSETRFYKQTRWPRDLHGEVILEVGCGSGRFTEQAAATGAMVIAMDYSCAVEANYAANGGKENVLIVQADLYQMPFREGFFDRIFCFGVLQHTPDPHKAFAVLPRYLRPGGNLAIDVYRRIRGYKRAFTKYWVRPLTTRIPPEILYPWCQRYVRFMWPVATFNARFGRAGRWLTWRLLIPYYKGIHDLSEELLKEWAILDTFDMLSPKYDYPQSMETVQRWFREARLDAVEIEHYGGACIIGRGMRLDQPSRSSPMSKSSYSPEQPAADGVGVPAGSPLGGVARPAAGGSR